MSDVNRIILSGRLGADPSLKTFETGRQVLSFKLATHGGTRDKPIVDWHSIDYWGKLSDSFSNCLRKGTRVCIEGRIRIRKWIDKTGRPHKQVTIDASNIVLMDSRKTATGDPTPGYVDVTAANDGGCDGGSEPREPIGG